jgi:hypothetical protein
MSLCRLLRAPAGSRPFPALFPQIFPRVPGPLPRLPPWCSSSFLPTGLRPSPIPNKVGAWQNPVQRLQYGRCLRGCSHSLMFRPPGLLATPVVPTAAYVYVPSPRAATLGFGGYSSVFTMVLIPTPIATSQHQDHALGGRDFYFHASLGSLPPRAVDILAVRIEQLTAEGLSPSKIRGLAGRS